MRTSETPPPAAGRRARYAVAALAAAGVAVVFATIGDGVALQETGWRGLVADHGHTAVWALLAAACGIAAGQRRWSRAAGAVAAVALVLYLLFLAVVLTA